MSKPVAQLGALSVLALVLTGCEGGRPSVDPPASPPSATAPSPTPSRGDRLPESVPSSVGQGLEIRYLDEDGNPRILHPKDFPRR